QPGKEAFMSATSKKRSMSRRQFLTSAGAMSGAALLAAYNVPTHLTSVRDSQKENIMTRLVSTMTDVEVQPFTVNMPEAALADLPQRITATNWPSKELVADPSQGVQLATMQALAKYWATDYDWRKFEAKLNALPQFVTNIDGLDIHFIQVKSKHENA